MKPLPPNRRWAELCKNLLCAGVVAWGLICPGTARAQAIFGTVKTTAGVAIEGVSVRATRMFPFQRVTSSTDFSGGYVVGEGLNGIYEVEAIATSYTFTPASINVTMNGSSKQVNFTSPSTVPAASTSGASNVTATSAILWGLVRPNGASTTVWFEYGLTGSYGSMSGTVNVGSGTDFVPVSITVNDLLNGTNHHFRIAASNTHGTRTGADASLATLSGSLEVRTEDPTDGGATTMRLNGSVIPNGANASGWFEWGTTTNYGNITATQALGSGTTVTNFSQTLTGLSQITYHYRAGAASSLATNYGADILFTPVFEEVQANLPGVFQSAVAWGDYDNDGLQDILLAGAINGMQQISQIWRNTGGGFVDSGVPLQGVRLGSVAWGDYDSDDRLDIFITGSFGQPITKVYRNGISAFAETMIFNMPKVSQSWGGWGDYDNDGRLDMLLTGTTVPGLISQIWRNTGLGFTNMNAGGGLPSVDNSSAAWGDYDNDGRLDILLTGSTGSGLISQVWRNTGLGFTNINAGLPGVAQGSVAWGDYDNDGRLDILLTGGISLLGPQISQVWRNTGSGFVDIGAGLPGVIRSSAHWGDYDNDGRLDILLTGSTNFSAFGISQVWRNTTNGFVNINAGLPGVGSGASAWGDYDNDGRLDILLTGRANDNSFISKVWRNHTPMGNSAPSAPSGLKVTVSNLVAMLSWEPGADNETPAPGLTYNVRIGTTPGGSDVLSPMAGANGFRRLPELGGAQHGLSFIFNYTLGTTYYWSVQTVDSAFAGSPFAAEGSFKILQTAPQLVPITATNIVLGDINADGLVDESELENLLAPYWASSPWLEMTNVAGLSGTNVTFALTNSIAGAFSVEYTTNLTEWHLLGPAIPRYEFNDTNAPFEPQRYYRLRWP